MKKILFFLMLILFSLPIFSQIYMSVDRDGTTNYSDVPTPNSKVVELSPTGSVETTVTTTTTTANADSEVAPTEATLPAEAKKPYNLFLISSPKDQETIQNQPTISVQISIEPSLQQGDKIILFFDNKPQGAPQEGLQFTLVHPDRGIHQLRAAIVNSSNNVLKETSTITIFVHYASVNFRPGA